MVLVIHGFPPRPGLAKRRTRRSDSSMVMISALFRSSGANSFHRQRNGWAGLRGSTSSMPARLLQNGIRESRCAASWRAPRSASTVSTEVVAIVMLLDDLLLFQALHVLGAVAGQGAEDFLRMLTEQRRGLHLEGRVGESERT